MGIGLWFESTLFVFEWRIVKVPGKAGRREMPPLVAPRGEVVVAHRRTAAVELSTVDVVNAKHTLRT
jgi:hypothetical protein